MRPGIEPGHPFMNLQDNRTNYLNVNYGVKSWLLTRGHKRIALLYLISISFFFVMGGVLALMIGLFTVGGMTGLMLAASKKESYVGRYNRPGAASSWHFLTGDQESISRLTDAVGFRYRWNDETNQFAHASGIMVLTPQGKACPLLFRHRLRPFEFTSRCR
jgi:hypothetical protein